MYKTFDVNNTLEQDIIKLWKSRGMNVEIIEFRIDKKDKGVWTIIAPVNRTKEIKK